MSLFSEIDKFFRKVDKEIERAERRVRKNVGWENILMSLPFLASGNIPAALTTTGVGTIGKQLGVDYAGALPFLAFAGPAAAINAGADLASMLGAGPLYEGGVELGASLGSKLGLGGLGANLFGTGGAGASAGAGAAGGAGGLLGGGTLGNLLPLGLGAYFATQGSKPYTTNQTQTTQSIRPGYSGQEQTARDYLFKVIQQGRPQPTQLGAYLGSKY